jgi:HK97 family phage major capsid protein
MNKRQLLAAKAAAIAAATALQTSATGRTFTDEERTSFDAHLAEANRLQGDIDRLEALAAIDRTAPAAATSGVSVGADHATERPWGSFGEQLLAVRDHSVSHGRTSDPRLYAAIGSNESVDAEGGFLVAPEYSSDILQRTYDTGMVTSRCQTMPMASNRLVINGLDENSRVAGQRYGGIQVFRISEAAAYTASKPKFRQIQLSANKLIGLLYATDEILEDAAALQAWAEKNFPNAFAFQLDDEVINGSGAGQFQGILGSGAVVTVNKDSGQTGNTVSSTNVLGMQKRLWGPSRTSAAWFINVDVEDQLWNLTRGAGTAVELLYTPPGVRGNSSNYGVMLGYPVIPIEQAAAGGTVGDIILADFNQYIIGQRGGMKTASSIHVQFVTGEQVFRWTLRNDGQPIAKKPLAPYKGSTSTSSFVVLQSRP